MSAHIFSDLKNCSSGLTFLKGNDTSHIQDEFKNPPDIKRDVFDAFALEDPDAPEDRS